MVLLALQVSHVSCKRSPIIWISPDNVQYVTGLLCILISGGLAHSVLLSHVKKNVLLLSILHQSCQKQDYVVRLKETEVKHNISSGKIIQDVLTTSEVKRLYLSFMNTKHLHSAPELHPSDSQRQQLWGEETNTADASAD